jgi:hypothetical protein
MRSRVEITGMKTGIDMSWKELKMESGRNVDDDVDDVTLLVRVTPGILQYYVIVGGMERGSK